MRAKWIPRLAWGTFFKPNLDTIPTKRILASTSFSTGDRLPNDMMADTTYITSNQHIRWSTSTLDYMTKLLYSRMISSSSDSENESSLHLSISNIIIVILYRLDDAWSYSLPILNHNLLEGEEGLLSDRFIFTEPCFLHNDIFYLKGFDHTK